MGWLITRVPRSRGRRPRRPSVLPAVYVDVGRKTSEEERDLVVNIHADVELLVQSIKKLMRHMFVLACWLYSGRCGRNAANTISWHQQMSGVIRDLD